MTSTLLTTAVQTKAAMVRRMEEGWDEYPADTGKGGQLKYSWQEGQTEDCPYIHRLRSDLANTYYWSGDALKDYAFFVANWHPLLGMFLCHPNHPWSKGQRFLMFLISLSVTMVPSAMIASTLHHGSVLEIGEKLLIILCVTIPDTLFGVILYQLSVADTKCPLLAPCIRTLEKCLVFITLTIGVLATLMSSIILSAVGADWNALLQPLVLGKVYSYLTWFPIFLVLPLIGFALVWRSERNALALADEESLVANEQSAPQSGA
jgi:hypothetical protein